MMFRKFALAAMMFSVAGFVLAGPLVIPKSLPYRVQFSMDDGSGLYGWPDANGTYNPDRPVPWNSQFFWDAPPADVAQTLLGKEFRAVWYCDQIEITNGYQVYSPGSSGFEVTGCVHGLEVVYALVQDPFASIPSMAGKYLSVYLEYAPTDDQNLDPTIPGGATLEDEAYFPGQQLLTGGGRATFYTDETVATAADKANFDPDGDHVPMDWVATTDGRLEFPSFGTLDAAGSPDAGTRVLFDTAFVNLQSLGIDTVDPDAVLQSFALLVKNPLFNPLNIQSQPGYGNGLFMTGFMNIIRGYDAADLTAYSVGGTVIDNQMSIEETLTQALGGDMAFSSEFFWGSTRGGKVRVAGVPYVETGWMFSSNDGLEFVTNPEPTTCLLLGTSIAFLIRRRRRG